MVNLIAGAACPVLNISSIWDYLDQYNVYYGAVFILGGLILVLLGRKLITPAVFVSGFLTALVLFMFLFYAIYFDKDTTAGEFWGFFAGGAVLGLLLGFLLTKFIKVGAACLSAWGGLCLGLIIYEAFLYMFEEQWIFWVFIGYCAVMCAVLVFYAFDVMCILGTVCLGSYGMVRGTAAYAGHYYNEAQLVEFLKNGLIEDIDPWYWAYVAGFVVMCVLGFFIQYRVLKKEREEEKIKQAKGLSDENEHANLIK